ncbi:MAG TPA: UvrD-helicase domain-containing protein [Gemmatimonadales bacterium]|nr:UvrD-helicase domain-containing protein [Gemmatimonadales bacterium]
MSASSDAEMLASLNPAQREAVEHVTGPALVVAGAGSGKTRVLTLRIARLIDEHGVPPERILAVTFTNKAAGEMKGRVGRLLERDPAGLWIGTFHSISARLLRREAEHLGFTRQFTIYDEDDRNSLIGRILDQLGHDKKKFTPRGVAGIISGAKNRMSTPAELKASAPFDRFVQVAAEVMDALGPALQAQNAMDFDDLLLHPVRLFHERPDRLAAWQERFSFVLVDEFQDTNAAQYRLVRFLGKGGNVFAVGDDDQSIYGWRGADVRNMQEFQRDFPGTRVIRLEENYRSTPSVLEAANAVIAENKGRIGKTLRTTRRGGEPVTVVAAADERDEAEWVAKEFGARRAEWDWNAMAVLYRTNAQSRALEEALRRSGTPYRIVGAISFYDRREVKDLLAYLRLVANPADDEAFLRAVNVPRRGIGDTSLDQVESVARQWKKSLLEAARAADRIPDLRPNVRNALMAFAEQVDRLMTSAAVQAPAQVLESLIDAIGYEKHLLDEGPEGADRWENVRELVAGAAEWSEEVEEGAEGTPLERFLEEAALLSSHDKISGTEEGVTLMTLHTAKGLEWPVVVMAGMEDGLFPLARAEETPDGVEEERRLAYVGITRARDKLFLTWARSRRRGGQLLPGIQSRFLRALPAGTIEEKRTGGWAQGRRDAGRGWRGGSAWEDQKVGFGWLETEPSAPAPVRPSGTAPAPAENDDAPRYVKGERVKHRKFGSGVIQGLAGVGRELKVTVRFDDEEAGVKQLLVAYAGLERDRDWESA